MPKYLHDDLIRNATNVYIVKMYCTFLSKSVTYDKNSHMIRDKTFIVYCVY